MPTLPPIKTWEIVKKILCWKTLNFNCTQYFPNLSLEFKIIFCETASNGVHIINPFHILMKSKDTFQSLSKVVSETVQYSYRGSINSWRVHFSICEWEHLPVIITKAIHPWIITKLHSRTLHLIFWSSCSYAFKDCRCCFHTKRSIIWFCCKCKESTGSLFRTPETTSEQLARFEKTAANNLGVERSVDFTNYKISICTRKSWGKFSTESLEQVFWSGREKVRQINLIKKSK